MKKFISMLLCLAMVLSLCAVTFAADVTATLVTDASTLKAGDQIVIVNHTGTAAMGSQNGGGYRNKVAASTTDDKMTVTVTADMAVVTLEEGTITGTFALKVSDGYLSFTGSSNKVYTVATKTDSESWQIAIAEDGAATVTNAKTTERVLQYNSNTNQERFACYKATQNNVTIYKLGEGAPVVPETPDEPVVVPATLAEQIAEANQLANGAFLAYESTITGEITDTPAASSYTTGAYKFTVSDGTNTLLCYYVPVTGGTPAKGDTVTVTGKLTAYNGAAQFNESASATIVKKAEGGTPETPDEPETPAAGVVDAPVAGTAYKFGMVQGNVGKTYYLVGGMDGYYMATTDDVTKAIDVYLETVEGGYYLYTMVEGVKTYINMVVSGTHVNGAYEATASTVYTYDATSKTIIATVDGAPYWFGTRNDKTYTTVGPVKTEYNGFYCQFYAVEGGSTPDVPDVPDVPEEPEQPEQPSGNRADFETLNSEGTGKYTQSFTTANGWTTVNSAIQVGGPSVANPAFPVVGADNTHKAVCLNGKTSAVGKLTSPTLTGGISKLTMDYTKMFTDTLLSVTITITDLSNGKTYTKTVSREEDKNTKYVVWTDEWVLETPITGDFTIEVVNNCPSSVDGNKDRFTILSLAWESAGGATEPEVNPDEEAAKAVDAQIEAIGEVTLEKETAITAARAAYEALSDAAKALVTKLETLTAAETELAAQKKAAADKAAADAVVAQINAIGEVTLESKAAIDAARAAYEALTADQKALVGNLATLEVAEETLQALQQQADKEAVDKAAAAGVDTLIEAIGEVTLEKEAAIAAARAAYEALTADQKALVAKLDALTVAETRLQELKDAAAQAAADKAAADAAAALIEKIGAVTKDSKAAIEAARAAYDALTDAQKALVENYETLTKAEEAFKGIANTGDNTFVVMAMVVLSMTAVVVLVSKKRAF